MKFRFTAGLAVFPILTVVSLFIFTQPPLDAYSGLQTPLLYLFGVLSLASLAGAFDLPVIPGLLRGLAVSMFVYTYPTYPPYDPSRLHFQTGLAVLIFGSVLAKEASQTPRKFDLLVRGVGLFVAFLGLSQLLKDMGAPPWLSSIFFYLGFAPLVVYSLGFGEALLGGDYIEKRAKGLIIAFVLIALYVGGRDYLRELFPEIAFLIDLALFVAVSVVVLLIVGRYFMGSDLEPFLLGEWEKHEARVKIVKDEALREAKNAIDEFVVRKNKLPLIAYLSYYGSRAYGSPDALMEVIKPLVEYEGTSYSSLTPGWLVKKYERQDMERRIRIVEEIIGRLRG
ncbi:hypothetical protein A3L09_02405 [Thermococcus profundus]|uniref:Uncharacterized protein n=1 Tax=Thermococcus profundus TaxID=49899 RepID=A0A2Z2MJQ8_THEPR|nr:hypothetical protein [Thermococcus profundus]ASJ02198.1 hypothetical protein A3L09_02405 [Thermococcus profundus]